MTTSAIADDADDDPRKAQALLLHDSFSPSENWDDDFEFQAGVRDSRHDATNAPIRGAQSHEQEESWDDAYEDEDTHASPVKRAPKVDDDDVEDWDSSDNEAHDGPEHDIQRDNAREFGVGGFEEEDKTVTARSTASRPRDPPPALPIPNFSHPPLSFPFHAHAHVPPPSTSPTLSTFSIPLSATTRDRASIYSQDPLMPSSNSSAPHLSGMRAYPRAAGSTPPRKGRRLRKKSRPPEGDIFELEDREPELKPIPLPDHDAGPATPSPPRVSTPPLTRPQPAAETPSRASQPSAPPTPSPSLLTRIGSLKRWARRSMGPDDPALSGSGSASGSGWRRARSSTGPNEIGTGRGAKASTGPEDLPLPEETSSLEHGLRAVSPTPAPGGRTRRSRGESASGQKAGWFFRAGGGGGSERDDANMSASSSLPAPAPARTPDPSPSKSGSALGLRRKDKDKDKDKEREPGGPLDTPTPRRKGKLVPTLKVGASGSASGSGSGFLPTSPNRASVRPSSRDGPPPSKTTGAQPRPISMQPSVRPMMFPRGGSASVGRSAGAPLSVSIADSSADAEKADGGEKERERGMRGLMNGVRRLSQVGAGHVHKRTKSTGGSGVVEVPRSSGEHSRAGAGVEKRPSQATTVIQTHTRRVEETHTLLPPVELDSPSSPNAQYLSARRGSLPWADYDPSSADGSSSTSAGYGSPPGVGFASSGITASSPPLSPVNPNPNLFPAHHKHPHQHRQSFSASATSLLAGSPNSPTKPKPARSPVQPQVFGTTLRSHGASVSSTSRPQTPPRAHALPIPIPQPPVTPSPVTHSASLGRSTSSPSHPGLRRNSLGDLKTQTQMQVGDPKTQLPSLSELKAPLGELKIPARISRAQQGLRRDLGMVREFAGCVEHLKRLQATYTALLGDLRAAYDASPASPPSRSTSPASTPALVQFHLPSRPPSQTGATRKTLTANPNASTQSIHQATSLNSPTKAHPTISFRAPGDVGREISRLEHEYGIWWECAELLVELGGGSGAGTASNPNLTAHSGSVSASSTPAGEPFKELSTGDGPPSVLKHMTSMSEPGSIFEQTLPATAASKGPPQASPPHASQWRASTGRHDLSARQLRLLKDMLSTPDPASLAYAAGPYGYGAGYPQPLTHPYPYAVAEPEGGRPWAAWNPSALTLPSEESSADAHGPSAASMGRSTGKEKKRRASRLGMLGLREILRSLKRNAVAEGRLGGGRGYAHGQQGSESSASNSAEAEDDHYNRRRSPWHQHDEHHAAKQSTGPEAIAAAMEHTPSRNVVPKSPRRPSLASIFRLGKQSTKNVNGKSKEASSNGNGNSTTEDERETDIGGGATGDYSDWERMSRSDLDLTTAAIGSGTATVRGKKTQPTASSSSSNLPYQHSNVNANTSTPKRTPATSQTSLWDSSPNSGTPPQPSRLPLSIAEEDGALHSKTPVPTRPRKERTPSWPQAHPPSRPPSRNGKTPVTGTVRSAPPADTSPVSDPKLALTPENIKPLLEYAREVSTRLADCIGEAQTLLSARPL